MRWREQSRNALVHGMKLNGIEFCADDMERSEKIAKTFRSIVLAMQYETLVQGTTEEYQH